MVSGRKKKDKAEIVSEKAIHPDGDVPHPEATAPAVPSALEAEATSPPAPAPVLVPEPVVIESAAAPAAEGATSPKSLRTLLPRFAPRRSKSAAVG